MRYKVGDTVVVRKDLEVGKDYGKCSLVLKMVRYLGTTQKINEVFSNCYCFESNNWAWSHEMIDHEATAALNTPSWIEQQAEERRRQDAQMAEILLSMTHDGNAKVLSPLEYVRARLEYILATCINEDYANGIRSALRVVNSQIKK